MLFWGQAGLAGGKGKLKEEGKGVAAGCDWLFWVIFFLLEGYAALSLVMLNTHFACAHTTNRRQQRWYIYLP